MKIVQLSTLWERTPPTKYGGLELVVSNLTEELVARGHEVTLFATGDSKTNALLKATYPRPLYREGVPWTSMDDSLQMVSTAIRYAKEWGADVIHNHQSHRSLAMMSLAETPVVNTIHGTLNQAQLAPDRIRTFRAYRNQNFISISNYQRQHARYLHWIRTVYNGIDVSRFPIKEKPKADYLFWIGRFSQTKGTHLAIDYAAKFGMKLLMAAKYDQLAPKDVAYFEAEIKPRLKGGKAEWVGEVGHAEKARLYADAYATLMPILWDEPFGLVVTESMACGTPVIAFKRGAMPELITSGKTGFLVPERDEKAFLKALDAVPSIDRKACRRRVERKFSVAAMADGYLAAYDQVVEKARPKRGFGWLIKR